MEAPEIKSAASRKAGEPVFSASEVESIFRALHVKKYSFKRMRTELKPYAVNAADFLDVRGYAAERMTLYRESDVKRYLKALEAEGIVDTSFVGSGGLIEVAKSGVEQTAKSTNPRTGRGRRPGLDYYDGTG